MINSHEWFVIKKYLKAARKGFLSILLTFSFLGVFIGVAALIIVIAVMTGFQEELKERIIGLTPHILVSKFFDQPITYQQADSILNEVRKLKSVKDAFPFVLTKTIVVKGNYTDGVILKGMNRVPSSSHVKMGKLEVKEGECLIGVNLAAMLRAIPGDTLTFYVPGSAKKTPFGMVLKSIKLVVAGVFDAGMYDFNTSFVFTSLKDAEKISGVKGVSGIELRIREPEKAREIAYKIEAILGYPYTVSTWMDMNKSLFYALKLEKITLFIVLSLIIVVASFGIITTLMMLVLQKTQEIGILLTLGYKRKEIRKIFTTIGFIIGSIGTFSGVGFGIIFSLLLKKYQFVKIPPDVYFINHIAVKIEPEDVIITIVATLIIVFLATLFPSQRASKLEPVDALRYE